MFDHLTYAELARMGHTLEVVTFVALWLLVVLVTVLVARGAWRLPVRYRWYRRSVNAAWAAHRDELAIRRARRAR
jgi:hypothetical protein